MLCKIKGLKMLPNRSCTNQVASRCTTQFTVFATNHNALTSDEMSQLR